MFGFNPRPILVGFMVVKVTLTEVYVMNTLTLLLGHKVTGTSFSLPALLFPL